jgi:hypothetical protein
MDTQHLVPPWVNDLDGDAAVTARCKGHGNRTRELREGLLVQCTAQGLAGALPIFSQAPLSGPGRRKSSGRHSRCRGT